ncbi:hypothetical protein J6590_043409 [Homalodisca vitripennis]|nr:hypothetical protein J6590_043409 [Homalodisca vitripennis]
MCSFEDSFSLRTVSESTVLVLLAGTPLIDFFCLERKKFHRAKRKYQKSSGGKEMIQADGSSVLPMKLRHGSHCEMRRSSSKFSRDVEASFISCSILECQQTACELVRHKIFGACSLQCLSSQKGTTL